MPFELRSARSLSRGERAELFTAAYEGYVVPFAVDEPTLAFLEGAFDLDLDASLVAFLDGEPAGLVNLGIRGEEGWIGGVGVVPAARRRGLGRALMEAAHTEARARGVRLVWLEVIDVNTAALALYEQLGYRVVRDVEVWALPPAVAGGGSAREVPAAEAHARIRQLRSGREPWQRDDATLAHYVDARGLVSAGGAAVFRVRGEAVHVVQLAGETEELLGALRVEGPVSILNLPADDPAAAVLRALGGAVAVCQREMLLEL